jgi:hypothetical protein
MLDIKLIIQAKIKAMKINLMQAVSKCLVTISLSSFKMTISHNNVMHATIISVVSTTTIIAMEVKSQSFHLLQTLLHQS